MILFLLLDKRFFGWCSLYISLIYMYNCGTNNYASINFRQYLFKILCLVISLMNQQYGSANIVCWHFKAIFITFWNNLRNILGSHKIIRCIIGILTRVPNECLCLFPLCRRGTPFFEKIGIPFTSKAVLQITIINRLNTSKIYNKLVNS